MSINSLNYYSTKKDFFSFTDRINYLHNEVMKIARNPKLLKDSRCTSACVQYIHEINLKQNSNAQALHLLYNKAPLTHTGKGGTGLFWGGAFRQFKDLTYHKQHLNRGQLAINSLTPRVVSCFTHVSQSIPFRPEDIAFGKADWNRYFGHVGYEEKKIREIIDSTLKGSISNFPSEISSTIYDYLGDAIPAFPENIAEILEAKCPFHPHKKVGDTHMLVLIPKMVNGKPLTLDLLEKLIQNPKEKAATKFGRYSKQVQEALGNAKVPKSYWILMTKDVVPDSRCKTYEEQKQLFQEKAVDGYELPSAIEAAASILMYYFKTDEFLYREEDNWTYTRCQELVTEYQWSVSIGCFSVKGLIIDDYFSSARSDLYGAAAVRKL